MRKKGGRKRPVFLALAAVAAMLIGSVIWVDARVKDRMADYGPIHAKTVCTGAINEAVSALLSEERPAYADLVKM
ncbi:MAG: hypothetical protein ACOYJY_05710, partial [Acutalibacteraceae bacterium]